MSIDLDRIVAIDVHTHAEVSVDGHDPMPPVLREASAKYFRGGGGTPTVADVAEHFRERNMAAVVFTVDYETQSGVPPVSNDEVIAGAAEHHDVLIPFASVDELVQPHPMTPAMAGELCERFLDGSRQDRGVIGDVRRILIERPGRFPSIEAMAAELSLHPRALRRRLDAEGTSYRDLVGEVRMKLAIEYLRQTEMTNEEIAVRLDYSDASNFRHAFARWTGKSPSEYRGG